MTGGRTRRAAVPLAGTLLLGGCDRSRPPITEEALRHATYLTDATEAGTVTLEDGEYRVTATPGAGGELRIRFVDHAVGDLDGDGEEDAAVILVEEGGNDRLFRLHALLSDREEGLRDVASRLLGDRLQIRGVRIVDDLIATDLVIRAPGEPVSAPPTVPATLGFALTDRGLRPIDPPGVGADRGIAGEGPVASLGRADWTLAGLGAEKGAELLAEVSRVPRLRFTVELVDAQGASGQLSGFAGCNRVFATYRAGADGGLRVSSLARTRRSCDDPAGELERLVIGALETGSGFAFEGEELVLRTSRGDLRFAPAREPPEDPLRTPPPAGLDEPPASGGDRATPRVAA